MLFMALHLYCIQVLNLLKVRDDLHKIQSLNKGISFLAGFGADLQKAKTQNGEWLSLLTRL